MMETVSQQSYNDLLRQMQILATDNYRKSVLFQVSKELGSEMDLDILLSLIIRKITQVMEADRSSLFLLDHEKNELWSKIAEGCKELRFPNGVGIAGHVCSSGEVLNIPDAYKDARFNPEFDRKSGYRTQNILCMPLRNKRNVIIGVVQVLNKKLGPFTMEDEELLQALGSVIAVAVENAQLYHQVENLFEAFLAVSTTALEERDPPTSGHSRRVGELAVRLARAVNDQTDGPFAQFTFTREQLKEIRYAAILHDFGKIGVREYILTKNNKLSEDGLEVIRLRIENRRKDAQLARFTMPDFSEEELALFFARLDKYKNFIEDKVKPSFMSDEDMAVLDEIRAFGLLTDTEYEYLKVRRGNLTSAERQDIENHPLWTYNLLCKIPWPQNLRHVPDISYSHHEKLDGTGYPRGLKADQLPLPAQILAIVDIFEALVAQDRPYKRAMPLEKARDILYQEVKSNHLNGDLVNLFFEKEVHKIEEVTVK